jgi:predicted aldo/keto reductase-like oxidoreductase
MPVTPPANSEALIRNDETMRYRPLGRTGLMVSALSFGCMRLGEDQDLNTRLVSRAIDLGVNYFETTRGYCRGQCQQRTAPGLVGKTAGVIVSGKAGINADTTAYSFRKEIERQLEILGLNHFKFFQVGWFGWNRVSHLLKRGGVLEALRRAQDEGLVQYLGFTGHDRPESFTRVIETGLFDTLTVPYNLINRAYEPTIQRAGELGVGVVAMCPVAGGALACDSAALKEALGMDLPTPEMALRFVLANPNVSTACSGMNAMAQIEQNVRTVKDFDPAAEAPFERLCEGLDRLRERLGHKLCTSCRYCLPCPQGVNIPHHLELYRHWQAFGLAGAARDGLRWTPAAESLAKCDQCGECEKKCPNELPVREMLGELAELAKEP